ncbi:MAG: Cytochrome c-556 [Pseudorhodoplanes sp.]|nr:Cytochrome c-556 [Pseudorhodoplanes sp.]
MMLRLGIVVVIAAGAATAVVAQSDPIAARKAEMKAIAQPIYRSLNRMQREQDPFDAARVEADLAQLSTSLQKLPALFPPGSMSGTNPGDEFRTSEKIWQNKADFEGRFAKLAKDVADNRDKAKTLAGLKEVYPVLRGTCDGCHQNYLVKN